MGNGFVEFGHYAKCFAAGFWRLVCPSLIVNQEILDAKTETAVLFVSLSSGSIGMEEELDRSRQQKSAD